MINRSDKYLLTKKMLDCIDMLSGKYPKGVYKDYSLHMLDRVRLLEARLEIEKVLEKCKDDR